MVNPPACLACRHYMDYRLVQASEAETLQLGGAFTALVCKPYHIPADVAFVQQIDVVGGHEQLTRTLAVGKKQLDEVGEKLITDVVSTSVDRDEVVVVEHIVKYTRTFPETCGSCPFQTLV